MIATALAERFAAVLRSRVFPGLWLDVHAALADNAPKIFVTLRRGLRGAKHSAFVAELKSRHAANSRRDG